MIFPAFSLKDQDGKLRGLDEFKDRKFLVIYFYPRDNTPGCTIEAKQFTDALGDFHSLGVEVMGVSTQSPKSHQDFCFKHDLKLILLSDEDKILIKELGISGKVLGFAKRTTYLVKPDGEIVNIWKDVSPIGHAKAVLEYVKSQL
ncbi:MAG TPA: peroxiredoxin [Nitrososphaerales archaeon]